MEKQRPTPSGVYLRSTQSEGQVTSDYSFDTGLLLEDASGESKMLRLRLLVS